MEEEIQNPFQNLSTEMKAILMRDEKLVKIEQRVTGLENAMTIDYGQQKVFSECNRDLKNYFRVNARNNVPKKRFDEAVKYISNWKPCTNAVLLIRVHNSQMSMDV